MVKLTKGQVISLTKETDKLSNVIVGLGWQAITEKKITNEGKKGLFKRLFDNANNAVQRASVANIDCDAVAYVIDNKKDLDMIYYGNLEHRSKCVLHMGDNLVGSSISDANDYKEAEQIKIDLKNLPDKYSEIIIGVNIYSARERNQHFGMVEKMFIRLTNADNKEVICQYNISDEDDFNGKTGMLMGRLYRENGEWKFTDVGNGYTVSNLSELGRRAQSII